MTIMVFQFSIDFQQSSGRHKCHQAEPHTHIGTDFLVVIVASSIAHGHVCTMTSEAPKMVAILQLVG